eukprot:CAMPEP_0175895634 /NCGR_PEP_ID=MMETSP0107_2-20121207/50617_1 /TAXON_ID=195067 ORGANISM="Goniomonas pacifica, Strain CCMP1869" /NCGR_SAMPLE_ID=MMETSP0107_2 /ASSEMBLY_ACC=CAM_ASM_000203 /LENGTH=121 /DNA_ID=CAMNT_0017216781 /DNA_START=39 /DNA_END=400 /DNA_ORIENTATION=-
MMGEMVVREGPSDRVDTTMKHIPPLGVAHGSRSTVPLGGQVSGRAMAAIAVPSGSCRTEPVLERDRTRCPEPALPQTARTRVPNNREIHAKCPGAKPSPKESAKLRPGSRGRLGHRCQVFS